MSDEPLTLRPLASDARFALVALALFSVVGVASLYTNLQLSRFAEALIANTGTTTQEHAEAIDARQSLLNTLRIASALLVGFAFFRWYHLAHTNLYMGGLRGLRFAPRWAVLAFLVPGLNIWRPFQVVAETWTRSREFGAQAKASVRFPLMWWVAVLGAAGSQLLGLVFPAGLDAEGALSTGRRGAGIDLIFIVAAALTATLVLGITDAQQSAVPTNQAGDDEPQEPASA